MTVLEFLRRNVRSFRRQATLEIARAKQVYWREINYLKKKQKKKSMMQKKIQKILLEGSHTNNNFIGYYTLKYTYICWYLTLLKYQFIEVCEIV